jgi:hypothetical protein
MTSDPAAPSAQAKHQQSAPDAPVTGQPQVDQALESLQGLESAPLSEHHDRLARAHEDLHQALNTDPNSSF